MQPFSAIDPVGDMLGWIVLALTGAAAIAALAASAQTLLFDVLPARFRRAAPAPA